MQLFVTENKDVTRNFPPQRLNCDISVLRSVLKNVSRNPEYSLSTYRSLVRMGDMKFYIVIWTNCQWDETQTTMTALPFPRTHSHTERWRSRSRGFLKVCASDTSVLFGDNDRVKVNLNPIPMPTSIEISPSPMWTSSFSGKGNVSRMGRCLSRAVTCLQFPAQEWSAEMLPHS